MEFNKNDKIYFDLQRPSFEQRFQFQKYLFSHVDQESLKTFESDNFGLGLYDKGLDYREWSKREEFSESAYEWTEDGVYYRGVHFQTGDILLTNQNSDSDGLFSTLLERGINFSHAAMYVTINYNGKKIPVVVEMNEDGVRSVPLKALLTPAFNRYVEVFRYDFGEQSDVESRISSATIDVLNEPHAFDMFQDRSQTHFLNCSRTIELIYKKAGFSFNVGESRYHKNTYPNLYVLGLEESIGKTLLMPDDIAFNKNFKVIGYVLNGSYFDVLSRCLVREYFRQILQNLELNPSLFSLKFHLYSAIINRILKRNWFSKVILYFAGMRMENFPSGPVEFLSFVPHADKSMKKAVDRVRNYIIENWSKYDQMSWQDLVSQREIKTLLSEATSDFKTVFGEKKFSFVRHRRFFSRTRKVALLNRRSS